MKKHITVGVVELFQRTICLVLAFVMLCDLTAQAMPKPDHATLQKHVEETINEQIISQRNPVDTLKFINEQLVKAFAEDEHNVNEQDVDSAFKKQTQEDFTKGYEKAAQDAYKKELSQLELSYNEQIASIKASAAEAYALAQQETSDEAGEIDLQASLRLGLYKASLDDEQEKALAQLKEGFEQAKVQLKNDVNTYLKNKDDAYQEYVGEYEQLQQDVRQAINKQLNQLLKEAVSAHKEAQPKHMEADKLAGVKTANDEFLSIVTILSSLQDKEIIFQGADVPYIQKVLKSYIPLNACATKQVTEYDYSGNYEPVAAIGGSPSAAKMFETQSRKKYKVEMVKPATCEKALSLLIPYGNVNGSASFIYDFVKSHYESASFGYVLLFGTRSLLLTRDTNRMDVLKKIVTEAIDKEQKARRSETGTWKDAFNFMEVFMLEYWTRQVFAATENGPYAAHNVVASGNQGRGEPQVWEDFAQILAKEMRAGNTKAKEILELAVKQCRLTANKAGEQYLHCNGIYPFLLGVLKFAPELAESLPADSFPSMPTKAGDYMDKYGNVTHVTEADAKRNREWVKSHDILNQMTKAEVLAMEFYYKIFDGQSIEDKMRIDNMIANSSALNKHHKMLSYDVGSDRYTSINRKINSALVATTLSSYFDFLISIVLLFDFVAAGLVKIGNLLKTIFKAKTIRSLLISFKLLPNVGLGKGVRMIRAFESAGLNPQILVKLNAWPKAVKNIRRFKTKTINNFRNVYAVKYVFKPYVKPSVFVAEQMKSGVLVVQPTVPAVTVAGAAPAIVEPHNMIKSIDFLAAKKTPQGKKSEIFPWNTKEKTAAKLNTDDLTVKYYGPMVEEDGVAIKRLQNINELGVKDGLLYINGQMAKTFKAYLPMDQLEALSALAKENGFDFNFKGVWVRLLKKADMPAEARPWAEVKNIATPSRRVSGRIKSVGNTPVPADEMVLPAQVGPGKGFFSRKKAELSKFSEKRAAFDANVITVPLYDETGMHQILAVGFNSGYKDQLALLKKLAPAELKAAKEAKTFNKIKAKLFKKGKSAEEPVPTAKLLYKDGKIYLQEGEQLTHLKQYEGLGLPKTMFTNVADAKKGTDMPAAVNFFNKLFTLGAKDGKGGVTLCATKNKLVFPMMVNALSYSASASALTMTLPGHLFSTAVGLGLPYISAVAAPVLAPFVDRFGARAVLMASMGLAAVSLGTMFFLGWNGNGLKDKGTKDPITGDIKLPTKDLWLLGINAFLTGLAATGVRASSNALLKAYETCPSSMVTSMVFKSAGALLTTLLPFIHYFCVGQDENKVWDFSSAYWFMGGLTLISMAGIRLRFPKKENTAAKITAKSIKESFGYIKPSLTGKAGPLAKHVFGITLMSSLEGYIYFKAISAVFRDYFKEENGMSSTPAKLCAAVATAVPQVFLRIGRFGGKSIKRQSAFNLGVANSAALALTGGLIYLIPAEDRTTDLVKGVIGGILVGLGTANIFQYVQKLALNRAKAVGIETAQATTVYSMGNLGLALPLIPAALASYLKAEKNYPELEANQTVSWIPFAFYLGGLGLLSSAEGIWSKAAQMVKSGWPAAQAKMKVALGSAMGQLKLINPAKIGRQVKQIGINTISATKDLHFQNADMFNIGKATMTDFSRGRTFKAGKVTGKGGFVGGEATKSEVGEDPYSKLRLLPTEQAAQEEPALQEVQKAEEEVLEESLEPALERAY